MISTTKVQITLQEAQLVTSFRMHLSPYAVVLVV